MTSISNPIMPRPTYMNTHHRFFQHNHRSHYRALPSKDAFVMHACRHCFCVALLDQTLVFRGNGVEINCEITAADRLFHALNFLLLLWSSVFLQWRRSESWMLALFINVSSFIVKWFAHWLTPPIDWLHPLTALPTDWLLPLTDSTHSLSCPLTDSSHWLTPPTHCSAHWLTPPTDWLHPLTALPTDWLHPLTDSNKFFTMQVVLKQLYSIKHDICD